MKEKKDGWGRFFIFIFFLTIAHPRQPTLGVCYCSIPRVCSVSEPILTQTVLGDVSEPSLVRSIVVPWRSSRSSPTSTPPVFKGVLRSKDPTSSYFVSSFRNE